MVAFYRLTLNLLNYSRENEDRQLWDREGDMVARPFENLVNLLNLLLKIFYKSASSGVKNGAN